MDLMMLASPLAVFFGFLFIAYVIYALGGALAAPSRRSKAKLSSYACGEDIPGGKANVSYNFFQVAFIFTVLHVAVLMLVLIPATDNALFGLLFLGGALAAVAALVTSGGARDA